MNGNEEKQKPRFNFGGNQQHLPIGFGKPIQPHGGPRIPEHFAQNDEFHKAVLAELKEMNQKLSEILKAIDQPV